MTNFSDFVTSNAKEEDWIPIAYYGQKLLIYQKSYTVTEKECLAVIVGVVKFRPYLEGKEFTIVSDTYITFYIFF